MVIAAVNAIEKTLKLKKNNDKLMHNNLFIEKLMDSIQAGILSCSLGGEILTANSQNQNLLATDKSFLLTHSVSSVIPA